MGSFPIAVTLFLAGMITILLPCILPLIPIVLGVSIAGRNPWRPFLTVLGMVVSFVVFTFLLQQLLSQFVQVADYIRLSTYYLLLLFGIGFITDRKSLQIAVAIAGGLFYLMKGVPSVIAAMIIGVLCIEVGGRIAQSIQRFGSDIQQSTQRELGRENAISAFIIGLTMGLVWVPCAGPALGFAFTLVRDEPGLRAFVLLTIYALGTAFPLMLIGYGGQLAVHWVRAIAKYSGRIKQAAGALLLLTALSLQYGWLRDLEVFLVTHTEFGIFGTNLEQRLFAPPVGEDARILSPSDMALPRLPKIVRAPEFTGLGPWHNSEPLTLSALKGKVVLIDFWTYSCINCIRTFPYIQGYWEKFGAGAQDSKFVVIGMHTPEFIFEKDPKNVADAIKRHGLTYPVAQDNDFGTWDAFANRYWPAKYLIDAEGYIRYTHFGEGAYEETEQAIESLLSEIGVTMGKESEEAEESEESKEFFGEQTPETYLGSRSWPALGNGGMFPTDDVVTYKAPEKMALHRYYLVGDWQMVDEERQVLRSDKGEIRMKFQGGEINLVMGKEDRIVPQIEVLVDGMNVKKFSVDRQDLFALWKGEYGEHEIVLKISGIGAEGYAFTFGQ